MDTTKMIGVLGADVGTDPQDPKAWSGSARLFFHELLKQGLLHRVFGVRLRQIKKYTLMFRNFYPNRRIWRDKFYLDVGHRQQLTQRIGASLHEEDSAYDILQIGAYYNTAQVVAEQRRCYSYNDGNLAVRLRSPYFPQKLFGAKLIDRTLKYESETQKSMARVFSMSEYLRRSFIDDYGVPEDRAVSIGAGVNFQELPLYEQDKDYESQQVLFVGVDFERKGGQLLLNAWRSVHQKFPTARLHVVGPATLRVHSPLDKGIVFHGFLRKEDPIEAACLDRLFRQSSLFVLPSLYEPFGIAPLEAQAYGVPAVVTDGWALRESVVPGVTGELFECGNLENLVETLTRCLGDADALRNMGERGRKRVLEQYTWEAVVGRLARSLRQ